MAKFDLIRLSLLPRPQQDAFEVRGAGGGPIGREEWLRHVFADRLEFKHRGKLVVFAPVPEAALEPLIAGGIGRERQHRYNAPPESHFEIAETQEWHAAAFLFDPRSHDDGQKIAIERTREIGQPLAVMLSLAATLNRQTPPSPYTVEVGAITEPGNFWNFVAENEGNIVTASFEFFAPNMFGIHDDYDAEMKALQSEERADRAEVRLDSWSGLNLATEKVKRAIDYISRGTGVAKAKTRDGHPFNSSDVAKSATVPDERRGKGIPRLANRLTRAARIIFGREDNV